ncbi:hypothetical protein LPE509_01313 [Legionella pneumophila subsp. pneumophila LPE509]|nr:hypothetical protein LPE509_01313 [Legionella pneumophila subsp. pneumophila LPE509]
MFYELIQNYWISIQVIVRKNFPYSARIKKINAIINNRNFPETMQRLYCFPTWYRIK